MIKLHTLSAILVAGLSAGCATYESTPVRHTEISGYGYGYGGYGPAPYPSAPGYVVTPAPVYVVPAPPAVYVAPPVYVGPAPGFSMHIQSGPRLRRHEHHPRDGRQRPRGGNAAGARLGGPGHAGTEWRR